MGMSSSAATFSAASVLNCLNALQLYRGYTPVRRCPVPDIQPGRPVHRRAGHPRPDLFHAPVRYCYIVTFRCIDAGSLTLLPLPRTSSLWGPARRRGFSCLGSIARRRLVDGLASSLSVLVLSVGALASAGAAPEDPPEHEAAAAAHRSALSAYVFFLSWLVRLAEAEERSVAATAAPGAPAGAPCDAACHAAPRRPPPCVPAMPCRSEAAHQDMLQTQSPGTHAGETAGKGHALGVRTQLVVLAAPYCVRGAHAEPWLNLSPTNGLMSNPGGRGRGRKKAPASGSMLEWEWGEQRDKCARALALAADADLPGLFRPRAPDPALLRTWAQTVRASCRQPPPGVRVTVTRKKCVPTCCSSPCLFLVC